MPNKAKYSEAGKGDRLRRGISYEEWEKKYEKIFNKKKPSARAFNRYQQRGYTPVQAYSKKFLIFELLPTSQIYQQWIL